MECQRDKHIRPTGKHWNKTHGNEQFPHPTRWSESKGLMMRRSHFLSCTTELLGKLKKERAEEQKINDTFFLWYFLSGGLMEARAVIYIAVTIWRRREWRVSPDRGQRLPFRVRRSFLELGYVVSREGRGASHWGEGWNTRTWFWRSSQPLGWGWFGNMRVVTETVCRLLV